MILEKQSRFDDFTSAKELVECNQCERYYINQCDGVKKGENKPCREFLATRKVNIPEEINALREQISWLKIGVTALCGIIVYLLIMIQVFGQVIGV